MIILGIDPGKFGGLGLIRPKLKACDEADDLPIIGEKAKARTNVPELIRWMKDRPCDHCFIERAQAMPRQGSSSGFIYGRCVGAIEATVQALQIPMTIVEPAAWKRYFKLPGGDMNKEAARQRALQLYPHLSQAMARMMDHGKAEALLIARFGWETEPGLRSKR